MKIAVLIISLCLVMIVGLQSCTIMLGGNIVNEDDLSGAGAVGVLVSFLFILGAAFSLRKPKVSMRVFIVAACISILTGVTSDFSDLIFWGGVSLGLAIMSFYGIKEDDKPE